MWSCTDCTTTVELKSEMSRSPTCVTQQWFSPLQVSKWCDICMLILVPVCSLADLANRSFSEKKARELEGCFKFSVQISLLELVYDSKRFLSLLAVCKIHHRELIFSPPLNGRKQSTGLNAGDTNTCMSLTWQICPIAAPSFTMSLFNTLQRWAPVQI